MPKLPDIDTLGPRPIPQNQRGPQMISSAGAAEAGAAAAGAIESGAGAMLARVGVSMEHDYKKKLLKEKVAKDRLEVSKAETSYLAAQTGVTKELETIPDHTKHAGLYRKKTLEAITKAENEISDPAARAMFIERANRAQINGGLSVAKNANRMRIGQEKSEFIATYNSSVARTIEETDPAVARDGIDALNEYTDSLVESGVINDGEATEHKRKFAEAVAAGRIGNMRPAEALAILGLGRSVSKDGQITFKKTGSMADMLGTAEREKMIKRFADADERVKVQTGTAFILQNVTGGLDAQLKSVDNNNLFAGDHNAKVRDEMKRSLKLEYNTNKTLEIERQDKADEAGHAGIDKMIADGKKKPTYADIPEGVSPAAKRAMRTRIQNAANGEEPSFDPDAWTEFTFLGDDALAKMTQAEFKTNWQNRLTTGEKSRALALIKGQQSTDAEEKRQASYMLKAHTMANRVSGKIAKSNRLRSSDKGEAATIGKIQEQTSAWAASFVADNKRPPTPQEVHKFGSGLLLQGKYTGEGLVWDSSGRRVDMPSDADHFTLDVTEKRWPDIAKAIGADVKDMPAIMNILKERGKTNPSQADIEAVYNAGRVQK